MVNVDKIKRLAELQGIKLTRVCETIGRKVYYLNDVKRCGGSMPQEYIEKIAALLSTTPEYLCDETDDPEIPPHPDARRVRRIPVSGNVAAGVPIDAIEDYEEMRDDDASKYGTIYERIRELRLSRGMSQHELAKKVGYEGRSAISKVESGERDISQSMIQKYADALGVTPIYLLNGSAQEAREVYAMQKLIEVRKSRGLTQKDIADAIGVSRQAYANYEAGNREPDLKNLLKIAEYLGVSTDYLLGHDPKHCPGVLRPSIYEKIQMLCRKEGFEISNLGEKIPGLSITRGSISGWKKGATPRADILARISDYFGCTVEYLLDKSDDQTAEVGQNEKNTLSPQEQTLIEIFRGTSETGRMKIIQAVMNICDECEKQRNDQ